VTTIEVMDPAANPSFDCAYAHSWHQEMRRAVDQRDVFPPAACEALARVLENFLLEGAVDDPDLDEVLRAIALLDATRPGPLEATEPQASALDAFSATSSCH
jgi:hypothetical protein